MLLSCLILLCLGGAQAQQGEADYVFMALGDWGDLALPGQAWVAEQMSYYALVYHPECIVTTGDNFYQNGIDSVDDPKLDIRWRNVYTQPSIRDLPWYITVGNHDYGTGQGEEWNQVDLTYVDSQWNLPHLWHERVIQLPGYTAHFFFIDTQAIQSHSNNYTEMLVWLDTGLAASTSHWNIVVGHRPVFSAGEMGLISGNMYQYLRPILLAHDVDMYLAGHDHCLELLHEAEKPTMDYIVSGGGGALLGMPIQEETMQELEDQYNVTTDLAVSNFGFVGFKVYHEEIQMDFINGDGVNLLHYVHTKPAV